MNWDVRIVPARACGVYVLFLYQLYIHPSDKQGLGTIASLYTYFNFSASKNADTFFL
jgi:hypothetical protein